MEENEIGELAARGNMTIKEMLNPKSTGFRALKLNPADIDDKKAAGLIKENPKIMRRPVLTDGSKLAVGFDPEQYKELF